MPHFHEPQALKFEVVLRPWDTTSSNVPSFTTTAPKSLLHREFGEQPGYAPDYVVTYPNILPFCRFSRASLDA